MTVSQHRIGHSAAISCLFLALCSCLREPEPTAAIGGDWRETGSPAGEAFGYRFDGHTLHAMYPDGRSFAAEVGGGEAGVGGEPGTTVSVRAVPATAFVQVYRRGGRPIRLETIAVINRNKLVTIEEEARQPPKVRLAGRQ